MGTIKLNLNKSLFIPKFLSHIRDWSKRWSFWCGSAGSGKSYTIVQKIIIRCCSEPINVLVCRRYATTLRNSCFSLFKEILDAWKLTPYVKIRESDMTIEFPNGSKILLIGLDNEQKLLSLNNVSVIWCEEAYEIEREKVEQLNLRMRGQAENQQLILSWNPISKTSWLYQFTVKDPPERSEFIHSTYRDNPFLPAEYVAALEEMKIRNPAKYRIYGDGEWGVPIEGLVIKNWATETFDPMALAASGLEHRCGMDVGWIDPSAVVQTLYDRNSKTIYIFNEFYRSGCQLTDLADAIKKMNIGKVKLYVDSAEPRTIQYLKTQGINAVGATKGRDSVKAGIMFLQDHRIIVHPDCKDMIRELENFSYIKSKQTGEWTEDTTHEFSHAIDAARYAYSDIYTNTKVKSMSKSALGL